MDKANLPAIGFDRFINLSWAHKVLEIALLNQKAEEKHRLLKEWIVDHVNGKDSARKTYNVLTRMWLTEYPETVELRQEAMHLAVQSPREEYLLLHWGISIANFRFFRDIATTVGKLLSIQGEFRRNEIRQRLLETYSNLGTVPRSVDRVLQTFEDWNVITPLKSELYAAKQKISINRLPSLAWLLEAGLSGEKEHHLSLPDLLRLPELFPFDINTNGLAAIHESTNMTVVREGSLIEYVRSVKPATINHNSRINE